MTAPPCPYCNALLVPELRQGRVVCTRCGEAVGAILPAPSVPETGLGLVPGSARRRWPLILVGLLTILVGGTLALWQPWDQSPSDPPVLPTTSGVVRPAELAGLGYLPESTDAVLAVQVPALLDALGPEYQDEPARALIALGVPDTLVQVVEAMTAVGLKDVEQLVLGLGPSKAGFPPQLVCVVRTRGPIDEDDLDRQTRSAGLTKHGRRLHTLKIRPPVNGYWWAADDRTLVVTLQSDDFEAVPLRPREGIGHLKRELRGLIETEVGADACVWLAADSDKWADYLKPFTTWVPFSPVLGRADLVESAARLRSLALSVPAGPEGKVDLMIALKSSEAATELRKTLADRFAGESVEVGGSGTAVRLQSSRDATRLRSIIGRLVAGPP